MQACTQAEQETIQAQEIKEETRSAGPRIIRSAYENRADNPFRSAKQSLYAHNRTARTLPSACGPGSLGNVNLASINNPVRCWMEVAAKKKVDSTVGSEELQKKAVIDLWKIVKRHGYVGPSIWSENTPVHEVLSKVIGVIGALTSKFDYEVQFLFNDKLDSFYIQTYYEYALEFDLYAFPIEYLPQLKEKSRKLHDLIVQMIAFMQNKCEIAGLNDDESDIENFREWVYESEDNEIIAAMEETFLEYETGTIARYRKLLFKKYSRSIEVFEKAVGKFKPEDDLERHIHVWLQRGLKLIKSGFSLFQFIPDDYYEITNAQHEVAVEPQNRFRILWSGNDPFYDEWSSSFEANFQSGGYVAPLICVNQIYPDSDSLFPGNQPDWPYDMAKWFETGLRIADKLIKTEEDQGEKGNG